MFEKYTTKQISELLGFSPQHIRTTAKQLHIEPTKEKKSFVYTSKDFQEIANALGVSIDEHKETPKETNREDLLELEIRLLKERLEDKDKQIANLQEENRALLDTNKALAFAIAGNTQKELIDPKERENQEAVEKIEEYPKKQGILKRIKRWLASS